MFWILYKIGIFFLVFFSRIFSYFDSERSIIFQKKTTIDSKLVLWRNDNAEKKLVVIHSASLGEFEIAIPLVSELEKRNNNYIFLFTFFSASGYNNAKISSTQRKTYLPFDKTNFISNFTNQLNPSFFIFIKYEYWFELLRNLINSNISFGFVNVNSQNLTFLLKFPSAVKILNHSKFFSVTNEKTKRIFLNNGADNLETHIDLRYIGTGKTRQETYKPNQSFSRFASTRNVIICGSIWSEDFKILKPFINQDKYFKWIIAPHKVDLDTTESIKSSLNRKSNFYSEEQIDEESDVVIIDTIGDLKYLYRYAQIAYIGGGFKSGLHNFLEPISYGLPVIIGPNYKGFPEAELLVQKNKIKSINNSKQFSEEIGKIRSSNFPLYESSELELINKDFISLVDKIENSI